MARTKKAVREPVLDDRDIEYKVVEISTVTDVEIERALNEQTANGWRFDSIRFVPWEGSRRPALAFLLFERSRSAQSP